MNFYLFSYTIYFAGILVGVFRKVCQLFILFSPSFYQHLFIVQREF